MLVQKYRKKRLTLETALFVQMTTSSVSKRVTQIKTIKVVVAVSEQTL